MKKTANAELGTNRFGSETDLLSRGTETATQAKAEPKLRLSSYRGIDEPAAKNSRPLLLVNGSAEHVREILWLIAMILIISIIHRYIPNSGTPPHSVVEVIKSTQLFPK